MRKYAFLLVAALAVMAPAMARAAPLTREEISSEIIDKSLAGKRMGMTVSLQFRSDGTVTMNAALMSNQGRWSYVGDGVCAVFEGGPRRGEQCFTFEQIGENRYRTSEGMTLTIEPR